MPKQPKPMATPVQSLVWFVLALVVAFDHTELAAQRGARRLQVPDTAAADVEEIGKLVEDQLGNQLGKLVDGAVQTKMEACQALIERESATAAELREQMGAMRQEFEERWAGGEGVASDATQSINEKVEVAERRIDLLQAQVEELKQLRASDHAERRRTQRTGGTDQALAQSRAGGEAAQIIMRNTRSTATAQPATGRGRRRAQAARPCDGRSLPKRVAAVGIVCCVADDDGHGHRRMQAECALPAACPSEACAATFVDFYDDCGGELAGQLGQYTSLYESCQGMRQGSSSIAMQLGVECTEDGLSDGECIPECNAEIHGYLMLLNVDGNDLKYSCQLHHTLYSWIGGAVRFLFSSFCKQHTAHPHLLLPLATAE
jgi:hypothetical protein